EPCELMYCSFGAECLVDEKLSRVTVVARTAAQIYSPRVWKRRNHLFSGANCAWLRAPSKSRSMSNIMANVGPPFP
ncbi:hypothetical protein CEXT_340711, partial [Caerostris extrusa]